MQVLNTKSHPALTFQAKETLRADNFLHLSSKTAIGKAQELSDTRQRTADNMQEYRLHASQRRGKMLT